MFWAFHSLFAERNIERNWEVYASLQATTQAIAMLEKIMGFDQTSSWLVRADHDQLRESSLVLCTFPSSVPTHSEPLSNSSVL